MASPPWHTIAEPESYTFPHSYHQATQGPSSQDLWSPVYLSSPSASTEYWSNHPTPFQSPFNISRDVFGGVRSSPLFQSTTVLDFPSEETSGNFSAPWLPSTPTEQALHEFVNPPRISDGNIEGFTAALSKNRETMSRGEQMSWSTPSSLEGFTRPRSGSSEDSIVEFIDTGPVPDTPEEYLVSLPQDEIDKDMKEMTCGPKLEEVFWPIRYQLSNGTKHLYEVPFWPALEHTSS
ncbi:hypothetical protein C8F04DRAFT_134062 [Mycena alexandri]|uniref:Uncharacterized protein n=1 Tax=Mycena alexandri TaxID=1745969 RepID=A0AAD6WYB1_9AGAR|nr:hypothetical protein C8F04DRAFT_134062 [Mycena alexandri]